MAAECSSYRKSLIHVEYDESIPADHIHPYMPIVFPGVEGVFQQDNATCPTLEPWTPNSLDLNPNLWDHLHRFVCSMTPPPHRTLQELWDELQSVAILDISWWS